MKIGKIFYGSRSKLTWNFVKASIERDGNIHEGRHENQIMWKTALAYFLRMLPGLQVDDLGIAGAMPEPWTVCALPGLFLPAVPNVVNGGHTGDQRQLTVAM